jgi:nucleotide-binding universal stress UspA family protein
MPKREKILVLMDTSEADKTLLKFITMMANASQTKEVHFFNSIRTMNIPEDVLKDFPDIKKKTIEERKQQITDLVNATLPEDILSMVQVHIQEGSPSRGILNFVEEHNIDLVIMGRHKDFVGGGILSNRLARRAACSLFIVPENSEPAVGHILVPCDYSPHSKIAMEEAILIARKYNVPKVTCQNVYTVPGGYHYSGKTYEEFAEVMEKNAAKQFKKFMADIDHEGVNIEPVYTLDENDDPVEDIVNFANKTKPDALIIGVKGRTATTALFIGSKAEQLIQLNSQIPMLVVRPKGNNAGIMDLLKEI